MEKKFIDPYKLMIKPHDLLDNKAMLLTSGDFLEGNYNTMTIGWGSFGTMWNMPFVMVVVRPTRFTFEFMEKYPDFTVTAFPKEHKQALTLLGTQSGRDGNKIKLSGLTPVHSVKVNSPSFEEAELIIECKKMYWQNFEPKQFIYEKIHNSYPKKDYHRMYFGEILYAYGTIQYLEQQ